MYIVIAGAGLIGKDLARELLERKHDVVVIDRDKEVCDALYAETGVIAIHGSVASLSVLRDARLENADVAVAATRSDGDNLTFAVLAKSLGVPRMVVRMRNPEYDKAYHAAGVDCVVRVTDLMVNQLIMDVEQPEVRRLTTIGGGRADVFVVTVPRGASLAGKQIREITRIEGFPSQCVIIAAYNRARDEFEIPRGDRIVNEGDDLYLISSAADIAAVTGVLTAGE